MKISNDFAPKWASKPGHTIHEILLERNLSTEYLATMMNRPVSFVEGLIDGEIAISEAVADDLTNALGSSSGFWLDRENLYRRQIEILSGFRFDEWLKALPVKEMMNLGWLNPSEDIFRECLNFFDVPDILAWNERYVNSLGLTKFRTSNTFDNHVGAVTAWIRQGEIQSSSLRCGRWNPAKLEERLDDVKALSRVKRPKEFLPELIRLCSECGIAVSVVPAPKGCRASGATKFIDDEKALLLLSFRYLVDDQFWFTFFHEIGHLLLHKNQRVHIEDDLALRSQDQEEIDANIFAAEILVPSRYRDELKSLKRDKWSIAKFASRLGVSPGIVIGQMQHLGILKYGYLNGFKRRYSWDEILGP